MTKPYVYDAFISYRHTDLDKYAAELLHKRLEAFRLPGKLSKRKDGRTRIERVFRDKDELPLTSNLEDPIMQALSSSEYLIVICSPRLRESPWCRKEIETFISMHGRDKVLAVLIEGEPEESFPEELLYREETVTEPDGTKHTRRVPMEPLAADIRGRDKKAVKKALRTELLRLLAPMFSLNYDDLRQRHRERRMKRILAASLSVGGVCLAFGLISTAMALRIRHQKEQIEAQAEEIKQQNEEIVQQNAEITRQNEELLTHQAVTLADEAFRLLEAGDRVGAVQTAMDALTDYEGIEMPYTAEAQYALTESLHVYDNGMSIKPRHQMETAGIIYYMQLSEDWEKLVTYDNSSCLTLWEIDTGVRLGEFRDLAVYTETDYTFLGNDRLVYLNSQRTVSIYHIDSGETEILPYTYMSSVYADQNGRYLILSDMNSLTVLDGTTYEELLFYDTPASVNGVKISSDGNYLAFEESMEDEGYFNIWNLETGDRYPVLSVGTKSLAEVRYKDGIAYALFNDFSSDYSYSWTTLWAIRPESAQILWEFQANSFGDGILLPSAEGASRLLLATTYETRLINMEDGSEAEYFSLGSSMVGGATYVNADYYMVFTRSGEFHMLNGYTMTDYYMSTSFLSHSQNVRDFKPTALGYLVLPFQDNRVTYYTYSRGEDLVPYEGNAENPMPLDFWLKDSKGKAEEMGLLKTALVSTIFYSEDETKIFVYYADNSLEIYNAEDMSLLLTMSDLKGNISYFAGTDKEGNFYLGGTSYGYMFNDRCQPLGVIEGLISVDAENNRLILDDNSRGNLYTLPIYTVEELLAKGKEDVLR